MWNEVDCIVYSVQLYRAGCTPGTQGGERVWDGARREGLGRSKERDWVRSGGENKVFYRGLQTQPDIWWQEPNPSLQFTTKSVFLNIPQIPQVWSPGSDHLKMAGSKQREYGDIVNDAVANDFCGSPPPEKGGWKRCWWRGGERLSKYSFHDRT